MEHSINYEKKVVAQLENVKIYVQSYEITRERKFSFMNCSGGGLYLTDNGTYPSYLKIKGTILRSECPLPSVELETYADNDMRFFLNMDGIYFNAAYLKSFSLVTDTGSDMVNCEVVLCCTMVEEGVTDGV